MLLRLAWGSGCRKGEGGGAGSGLRLQAEFFDEAQMQLVAGNALGKPIPQPAHHADAADGHHDALHEGRVQFVGPREHQADALATQQVQTT